MVDTNGMECFCSVSRHDFFAFYEWVEMNAPGELDIYRPNYFNAVMSVLKRVKEAMYAE
jgi:hypothetical protein